MQDKISVEDRRGGRRWEEDREEEEGAYILQLIWRSLRVREVERVSIKQ